MHTHPTRLIFSAILSLLLATLAGSCANPDFEEFWEVRKLRTIAVVAEPPELGPLESMQLRAESFSPTGEVTHRWTLCLGVGPAEEGYPCEAVLDEVDVIELGEGDEVELLSPLSAEEVDEVCELLAEAIGRPCTLGVPVFVRLVASDGDSEVVSLRSIVLLTGEAAERSDRNENPRLAALTWNGEPLAEGAVTEVALDADGEARLQVAVSARSAQQYTEPRTGEESEERLTATWFTTAGEIEFPRTFFGPRAPLVELQRNTLSSTLDRPIVEGEELSLFVVLRDNRGGVAALRRDVRVADAR